MFSAKPNDSFADTSKTSSMEAGRQKKWKTVVEPERYLHLVAHSGSRQYGNGQ